MTDAETKQATATGHSFASTYIQQQQIRPVCTTQHGQSWPFLAIPAIAVQPIPTAAVSGRRHPHIRRTRLSTVDDRAFPVAGSRLWTVCRPTQPQLQRRLFSGTVSKLISFPDHFLPDCFRFLVLYTLYSSGLAVLCLSHCK